MRVAEVVWWRSCCTNLGFQSRRPRRPHSVKLQSVNERWKHERRPRRKNVKRPLVRSKSGRSRRSRRGMRRRLDRRRWSKSVLAPLSASRRAWARSLPGRTGRRSRRARGAARAAARARGVRRGDARACTHKIGQPCPLSGRPDIEPISSTESDPYRSLTGSVFA